MPVVNSALKPEAAPALFRLLSDSARSRAALGACGFPLAIELALGAVRSAEGQLTHWVVTFSDCSELERLRAELEKLRALAATP